MNFETVGSIVAIFIGLCALAISVWQGLETSKNYRLSMTPNLLIWCHWLIDSQFPGISIVNKGIGPAIITSIEVIAKDKHSSIEDYTKGLYTDFLENLPHLLPIVLCYHTLDLNQVISANEKLPIIWIDNEDRLDRQKVEALEKILSKITIKIEYKSFYDQKFQYEYTV